MSSGVLLLSQRGFHDFNDVHYHFGLTHFQHYIFEMPFIKTGCHSAKPKWPTPKPYAETEQYPLQYERMSLDCVWLLDFESLFVYIIYLQG